VSFSLERVFMTILHRTGLLAGAVLLLSGASELDAQERPLLLSQYQELARESISGERARGLVDFMDPSYRLPGNAPFDAAIHKVAETLREAGYVEEGEGAGPLTFRLEEYPLSRPTWEPVGATLSLVEEADPLMTLASNINLVAAYSHSTPAGGVEAEVVYVGQGTPEDFQGKDVAGKIVMGEGRVRQLFAQAVLERGALGVLSYRIPAFNRPEVNLHVAPMSSIPYDSTAASWGLLLSGNARNTILRAMEEGPVRVRVDVETRIYPSTELTLVAEVRGALLPRERLVFSAHVQESGANDNATGVAALAEIAGTLAQGVRSGAFEPHRSVTMIWGDEISSTRRYLTQDTERAKGVIWGLSLDMVGEDTEKTGGTFLIEKMPDPSAVWTRGEDKHTEWGGRPLTQDRLVPHYLNDFVLSRCLDQAADSDWVVRTNPYEGGSDHVPFLQAGTAGLLLWHFTDQHYHTDGDRLEMVSAETLWNVSVSAAVSAMTLVSVNAEIASYLVGEVEAAALARLETEVALSREALAEGGDADRERLILESWTDWYLGALAAMEELEAGGVSASTAAAMEGARARVREVGDSYRESITPPSS
jgi:hypothetical protein